ncbi:hypothetical protein [Rhizobium sp. BE258]|jgi:hypothetical protein|uniref:hypothetical protein n=1 Tax=unclassified Rhizobium TaxID=2613769 RepID=UPI000DD771DB|nr:hypothetical protein [Rhizobium sp. BE258]MDR7142783.1 hypothetical protein [Rhizobium sp. BE258]
MLTLEDALMVSAERVAHCRGEVELDIVDIIDRFEAVGFSRKEVLVALSEILTEQFAGLPDLPRFH